MTDSPQRSALLTSVLGLARDLAEENPAAAPELREIADRAEQPLRVAIAGKVKAGKSTLLNALVGDELAPTDAGECTKLVTWYQHGLVYKVEARSTDGSSEPLKFTREDGAIEVELGDRDISKIERLTVEWPVKTLSEMTLIDTPGIASMSKDISARSHTFLSPDDEKSTPSDAVIYLLRHLHATDVSFLHSFQEDEYAQPSPINCVAVLSRADEVAVGRLDAMESANKIATRYGEDPRLRRLVQTVMPVAGLLAQAGTGLRELEYRRLAKLAACPVEETEKLLLTADRFANAETSTGIDEVARRALLARLGVFGVRLAIHGIRTGDIDSTAALATILREESGIDRLRSTLFDVFGARRDTLKARSALLAIQRLAAETEISAALDAEIERTIAGAHEFTELSTLNDIRSGALKLSGDDLADVERLIGASGTSVEKRLGIDPDTDPEQVKAQVIDEIGRWRQHAESPLTPPPLASAARVVVRSCEAMFMAVSQP